MFVALVLSLAPGAGADSVTWRKCKEADDYRGRVLEDSWDEEATWLDITTCNLTDVRPRDFHGLPELNGISLQNNAIAHVDPVAFSDNPRVTSIVMSHNDLHEAPLFDNYSFCPRLMNLVLDHNKITELNHPRTFSGCLDLHYIYLNDNAIEYIHPDIFKPLRNLIILEIENNRLSFIPENLLIHGRLGQLYLSGNKISYLTSDFVSKHRMAGATLHAFYFVDNPWHCACLLELLAEVKRAHIVYYLESAGWYTGSRPSCVYTGAFSCSRPAPSGLMRRAGRLPIAGVDAAP